MLRPRHALVLSFLLLWPVASVSGEVLVRWDQNSVPSRESLGISTLVVPAANSAAVRDALQKGYRVLLETDPSAVSALKLPAASVDGLIVKGTLPPGQLQALRRRLGPGARVFNTMQGALWPHVRLNWVTLRNDVLQVSSRTAQPWIEGNGTRLYLERLRHPTAPGVLTYAWQPITVADVHQGPAVENYLVAIAEAGTFGGDLLLPLHERFQRSLLLGHPVARAEWQQIRRALEFYSWDTAGQRQRVTNIGVVTAQPEAAYVILNLLLRHNLPPDVINPRELASRKLESFPMLVVVDKPDAEQLATLERFARAGGTVVTLGLTGQFPWHSSPPAAKTDEQVTYGVGKGLVIERGEALTDPNSFALSMRQALARQQRAVEIWNGTTVIANLHEDPETGTLLIGLVNYAHEGSPIQVRVRGTYSTVHYETPDAPAILIPHRHSNGQTEFVVPDLRVGGRVFLSTHAGSN